MGLRVNIQELLHFLTTMVSPSMLLSCFLLAVVSMAPVEHLNRSRRAPQLVGAGPSGAVFRNRSSGVGGIMTLVPSAENSLGGIRGFTQSRTQQKSCRRVYNRRFRKWFRICD